MRGSLLCGKIHVAAPASDDAGDVVGTVVAKITGKGFGWDILSVDSREDFEVESHE